MYLARIKEIIQKHLPAEEFRLFVFGSRAKGQFSQWSDIDVGIWGKKRIRGSALVNIEEELENSRIPYRVEIVDFNRVSEDFKEVALQSIINL